MGRWILPFLTVACLLPAGTPLPAATVLYDVRPVIDGEPIEKDAQTQVRVTVAPTEEVAYQVTALVTSAPVDPANPVPRDAAGRDNNGLSFFRFDLLTTLGAVQAPATAFVPPVDEAFTLISNLGQVSGDDILQITGAQDTLGLSGVLTAGIGWDEPQPLVEGQLITGSLSPTRPEAQFVVRIGPGAQASVFQPGTFAPVAADEVEVGRGFIILVRTPRDTDPDDDTTDDDDADNDNDDATNGDDNNDDTNGEDTDEQDDQLPFTLPEAESPILTATVVMAGVSAVTLGLTLLIGPLAGAIGIVLALAALLLLLVGGG